MPASGQLLERGVDVVDAVGDVVETGALALEELADRRVGPERAQELDVAVADVEQDGLDALLLDRLAVGERHRHRALVERQRGVEVVGGNADVIDQAEHPARVYLGLVSLSSRELLVRPRLAMTSAGCDTSSGAVAVGLGRALAVGVS